MTRSHNDLLKVGKEPIYINLSREKRGLLIAQTSRITRTEKGWKVPSQSGAGEYLVVSTGIEVTCTCPDYELRHGKCKHIFAVEYTLTEQVDSQGNRTVTETLRKTYSQNWSAYDKASTQQQEQFMKLLADITLNIEPPQYNFGRPTLPVSDMVYSAVMKIYSTFSLRRFMGDMTTAQEKGYISSKPCFSSVGHFLQREDITPILCDVVKLTSLPLKTVENKFSIDSTGFGTSNFQRWFSFKHGREINSRRWVKCHFTNGVKTNIVTSVKVTSELGSDCPQFKELIQQTAENFDMDEVSADKAYSSRANHSLVAHLGATPFIPFKSNANGKADGSLTWKKMYHYFMFKNEEFLQHYHLRSNAETTVHMIKSKFGDSVRSKTWTAQVNEVLCKVIAHNICVVIQEKEELGIKSQFCVKSQGGVYKVEQN